MATTASGPRDHKDSRAGGLEGILGGLSTLLGTLAELAEKGHQLQREGSATTPDGKDVRFHYGISVRTANGGRDVRVEPFGTTNLRQAADDARSASVQEVREPLVDVFEEEDHVLVVAEMPGITVDDVTLELRDDVLDIRAERGEKRYAKEVLLPRAFTRERLSSSVSNGVVEIRLTK